MSLQSLKHQGTVIGLEAVSGETALVAALNRLPSYLQKAQGVFKEQFDRTLRSVLDFAAGFANDTRRLRRLDYAAVREKKVQVPAGLSTDILTYVRVLDDVANQLQNIESGMIAPYLRWLNGKLAKPEELRSLTSSLDVVGYKPVAVDKLHKAIDACFQQKGRQEAMLPYGEVVRRSADWDEINKISADVRRALSPALHKGIQARMQELNVSLETLILRLTKSPDKYTPNAKVLQEIVNVSYAVAEAIELYGIVRYRYQEYEHSINTIASELN